MTSIPHSSGIDLARAALAAARASAKSRPAQPQKKARTRRPSSGRRLGDPMGLGAAIDSLMADHGWEPPEQGGSILDQWPTVAPELVDKVAAVRFEHDTGTLHLRPVSPAYATQLRLHQTGILAKVQQAPSGRSVRALKILPVGAAPASPAIPVEEVAARPADVGPVRTRETASAGYRATLAAALEHRPETRHTDPYLEQAMRRQEAALRANRMQETVEEPDQITARKVERSDAVRRAALARKRQEQAGHAQPGRDFDVA
jgi:hypothetical protein